MTHHLRRVALTFEEIEKVFDPVAVYGDAPNPTKLRLRGGSRPDRQAPSNR